MIRDNMAGTGLLDALLRPRSIAILGASDDPTRIGGRPLAYLKAAGYAGRIFPVNPKRETVQGLPAWPSIDAVPESVEFAILAVPAALIIDAARACGERGVKACVVFSAGFAEAGPEGEARQAELLAVARAYGMRIVGPNCLGLFNATDGFYPVFSTSLDRGLPPKGRLSIVSQSGAFGTHLYWLAKERGLGMRYFISTGNECDVHVAECLRALAEDPGTGVIMAYLESAKDGPMLVEALETARRNGKPVAIMKVGRSEVGAEAARSHTAALAGADAAYDAVLRQYGAVRARTTEELVDIAHICSHGVFPRGDRIGLVSISGGIGVLMADAASDAGLDVAPMPEATQARLKEALPFASPRNPVDITAQAFNDFGLVESNLKLMAEEGGYDGIVVGFSSVAGSPVFAEPLLAALGNVRRSHPETLLIHSCLVPDALRLRFEAAGVPVFPDPSHAVEAFAAAARFGRAFAREERPAPELPAPAEIPRRPLGEHEAKRLLAEAGVPVPAERLAGSAGQAVEAFRAMGGGKVVMKLVSPDIAHKTEIGGVLLNLADEEAVRLGYGTLVERAALHAPQARLDGILVTPMLEGGVEMIMGVQVDPVFGPLVMLGLGGVFVEVMKDVTLRLAPFGEEEAMAMIGELRGRALLEGARGQEPADVAALAKALAALSRFAAANAGAIESVDVNPFRVLPKGQGAVALDALVVPRSS
ncbi:acetate--CoA ligase family protein [Geminicoccaceae bacterium 1502E]|nr:acetate--CoA ligase family protein [Geminicoccaceae bacterium 1502E]